jgi:hypothetical protein
MCHIGRAQRSTARQRHAPGAIGNFPTAITHTFGYDQTWLRDAITLFIRRYDNARFRKTFLIRLKIHNIGVCHVSRPNSAFAVVQVEI